MAVRLGERIPIERVVATAYTIPTEGPESDGTFAWQATTLILVELWGGDRMGVGFSYGHAACVPLIRETLAPIVRGRDALELPGIWGAMVHATRNLGRPGLASTAVSAVDAALWDLKAKLLDLPLVRLLGRARDGIEVYGSGGFTSYGLPQLQSQLAAWVATGIRRVKMKVGSLPEADPARVRAAREAIGPRSELFVDANGAYQRKQALYMAERFQESGVTWFEEPVSSDDLEGLRLVRDRAPAGMAVAAGEYGYDPVYFRRMLESGAVDVLQADATRCLGITGFLKAGALCEAYGVPLSAHTAPSIHAHPCCSLEVACHVEYFHDHARIEGMLFEGALAPHEGRLTPDLSRPGLGLAFKRSDAERFRV